MSPLHRPLWALRPHQSRHGTLRHVSRISRASRCHREVNRPLRPSARCPILAKPWVRDHNSPSLTGQVGYALEGGFMNTNEIVLAIDAEISRLQQAKALLTDTSSLTHAKRKQGRPAAASGSGKATSSKPGEYVMSRKRRGMSDAGRARIAAAQKARWARFKKAAQ